MRRAMILVPVFVLGFSWPASASGGCEVFTTGHPSQPGNCRYIATGPGAYEVRTLSGFRIMASADGGTTWRTLAARVSERNQPHTGVVIGSGELDTRAGELVDVAIGVGTQDTSQGPLRYQDGTLRAFEDGY